METPPSPNDNKINFNASETFNMKVNEKDVKLKLSYNEQFFLFEAEEADAFPKNEFCLLKSLEELTKIDKYFRQFDTLKEVFDSIKQLFQTKNISVIKEDKQMKLKIKNILANKEFFISLPLKEKDIKSEMEHLIPYISSLNNKITNLENQISQMKIDFDNRLKALEKKHQDEIEKNLLTIRLFQDSNIVQSNEKELI